ncbi:MAG TPA: DUF4097 family beta strand repeat-containing protein [Bacillales bacterium]|nr:DUF4097 family beta strand repeat-containing protein [Bacillales bacterium]
MGKEAFLEKMKRYTGDFDKTFGGEPRTETDSIDGDGLEDLEVAAAEAQVVLRTHEGDQIDIELDTYEGGPKLETEREDAMLKISAEKADPRFSIGRVPTVQLTVRVPDRLWNSLAVDTESGGVKVSNVDISRFGAKTNSGDLEITKVKADETSLRTSSGDMEVRQLEGQSLSFASSSGVVSLTDVGGDIYGKAKSGKIDVDGFEGGELELKSRSGSIDAQKIKAAKVYFRTTSGEIDVDELDTKESVFEADSGEITGRRLSGDVRCRSASGEVGLEFEEAGSNVFVDTKSGDIELRQNGRAWNAELKAHTSSGDIRIGAVLDPAVRNDDHRVEGIIGTGEGRIELNSRSGDIELS